MCAKTAAVGYQAVIKKASAAGVYVCVCVCEMRQVVSTGVYQVIKRCELAWHGTHTHRTHTQTTDEQLGRQAN